jgi:hypothetical protein
MASVIQGSGICQASYVVTFSDLHTVMPRNLMDKYADNTYLIIHAINFHSCAVQIAHVEESALLNSPPMNRNKSAVIVFVAPLSKRVNVISPHSGNCTRRVDQGPRSDGQSKVLGGTARRRYSSCSRTCSLCVLCGNGSGTLRNNAATRGAT